MDQLRTALDNWKVATHSLPWGVQSLALDTLKLAAEGKVRLVHSIDAKDGKPCLFNAISNLSTQQNGISPSGYAPDVVRLFDEINSLLITANVNKPGNDVAPLTADILVHHFGQVKEVTQDDLDRQALALASFVANCTPYTEPTDEEMITNWLLNIEGTNANATESPVVQSR